MDFKSALNLKNKISSSFLPSKSTASFLMAAAPAGGAAKSAFTQSKVREDVKGVGVGEKNSGENYIKVLTRKGSSLSPKQLGQYFDVSPKSILVQPTPPIRLMSAYANHRPPYPGISVAHFRVTAGTLGCFVKDSNKKLYILSNNHVLANINKGKTNDVILQPGKLDGGRKPKDIIAGLSEFITLEKSSANEMDAAIAAVTTDLPLIYTLNGLHKVSGSIEPVNGMRVEKFGRNGHTKGRITVRNLDVKVDVDGTEMEFEDQFEVKGYSGAMFCDGGDSGSLIYERETYKAVGLLFAGTEDGTTFATPIKRVLKAFSVKIA